MSTRLFHTVVLVGVALGAPLATASCGGSESGNGDSTDAKSDAADTSTNETWPGIGFVGDSGSETWVGIRPADTGSDTWPGIRDDSNGRDSGADSESDTWTGIRPPPEDTGTDTWPGISPVLDTGSSG